MCETDKFWRHRCAIGPAIAVFTLFLYMGAQEITIFFWDDYFASIGVPYGTLHVTLGQSQVFANTNDIRPGRPTLGWELLGTGLFAIGRFVGGFALLFLCPRIVLFGAVIGCAITSGLAITQTGRTGATMLILCRLFEVCIYSRNYQQLYL